MLTPDKFFYRPVFTEWTPTNIAQPLPVEMLLKFAETANTISREQLEKMQGLKKGVFDTTAILNQDVDYRKEALKEIEQQSAAFATKNLLDASVQAELNNFVNKWGYDPELSAITQRTAQIQNSYKTYNEALLKGETSSANFYPVLKSIEGANAEYEKTKTYNPNLNLDTRLRPFSDYNEKMRDSIKILQPSTIQNSFGKKGNYIYLTTQEGITKDKIVGAALSSLGTKELEQLQLEYDYDLQNQENATKDIEGNAVNFETYIAQKAINLGDAFESSTQKISNLTYNQDVVLAQQMKIAKMQEANRVRVAQMELQATLSKLNTTTPGTLVATDTSTTPLKKATEVYTEITQNFNNLSAQLADKINGLEKAANIEGITSEDFKNTIIAFKKAGGRTASYEGYLKSKSAFPDAVTYSTEQERLIFNHLKNGNYDTSVDLLDTFEKTKGAKEAIQNVLKNNVKSYTQAQNAARGIAEQNKEYAKLKGLDFLNPSNWGTILSAIGNPEGQSADAVISSVASQNYTAEYNPLDDANIISNALEELNGYFDVTAVNTTLVPADKNSSFNAYTRTKTGIFNSNGITNATDKNGKTINIPAGKILDVQYESSSAVPSFVVSYSEGTGKEEVNKTAKVSLDDTDKVHVKNALKEEIVAQIERHRTSGTNVDKKTMTNAAKALADLSEENPAMSLIATATNDLDINAEDVAINIDGFKQQQNIATITQSPILVSNGSTNIHINIYKNTTRQNDSKFFLGTKSADGTIVPIKIDQDSMLPATNGETYMSINDARTVFEIMGVYNGVVPEYKTRQVKK